eukprot:g18626.t1
MTGLIRRLLFQLSLLSGESWNSRRRQQSNTSCGKSKPSKSTKRKNYYPFFLHLASRRKNLLAAFLLLLAVVLPSVFETGADGERLVIAADGDRADGPDVFVHLPATREEPSRGNKRGDDAESSGRMGGWEKSSFVVSNGTTTPVGGGVVPELESTQNLFVVSDAEQQSDQVLEVRASNDEEERASLYLQTTNRGWRENAQNELNRIKDDAINQAKDEAAARVGDMDINGAINRAKDATINSATAVVDKFPLGPAKEFAERSYALIAKLVDIVKNFDAKKLAKLIVLKLADGEKDLEAMHTLFASSFS